MARTNSRPWKTAKNTAIYILLRVLIVLIRVMGRKPALLFARLLAVPAFHCAAGERKKMEANLSLALGNTLTDRERRSVGKRTFIHAAQNLADAVLMERMLRKDPDQCMTVENQDLARRALERGGGIVFLTAHLGCFEMMPPRFSLLGFPIIIIGARIYDERLNALIARHRRMFDVQYVERDNDIRAIVRGLKEGRAFGVLCDLNTRGESRDVPFFGFPAQTLSGPFKLALKFGAALIPVFTLRGEDHRQHAALYPEIVPEGKSLEEKIIFSMRAYHRLLEEIIRKNPAQWIWMHERWKS
jgi:KDO2-lipid IV(A) lauroyltransferase